MEGSKLQVGDKVILKESSRFFRGITGDAHNPGNRVGTVTSTGDPLIGALNVKVHWDNGLNNSYTEDCLTKLNDTQVGIHQMIGTEITYSGHRAEVIGFGGRPPLTSPLVKFKEWDGGHNGNGFRTLLGADYNEEDKTSVLYLSNMSVEGLQDLEVHVHGLEMIHVAAGSGVGTSEIGSHTHTITTGEPDEDRKRLFFSPLQINEAAEFLADKGAVLKSAEEYEKHIYERLVECYRGDWKSGFSSALGYTIRISSSEGLDYDGFYTTEATVTVDPSVGMESPIFQAKLDSNGEIVAKFPQ